MTTGEVSYMDSLRAHIGHAPVIMTCAGCAVLDESGRVLLQRRGDPGGPWGLPGGAMELGETLAETAVRETREETGLDVRLDELLGVYTEPSRTHPNGDVVQAVVVVLTATRVSGQLAADGKETIDLGWFALDDLPQPIFSPHEAMLEDLRLGRRGRWV